MIINGKEFFTVVEMAELLSKKKTAVRQLLHNKGIKPVSKDALYAKEAYETLKEIPPWGWVKGKSRKETELEPTSVSKGRK